MWYDLTGPQATVISGFLNFVAPLLAVIIGTYVFTRKISSLESGLLQAERTISKAEGVIEGFGKSVEGVHERLKVLEHKVATKADIDAVADDTAAILERDNDSQEIAEARIPFTRPDESYNQESTSIDDQRFEEIRNNWFQIQRELDSIASRPSLDGRTRARYRRIDRRRPKILIAELEHDGHLGDNAQLFYEAEGIWQRNRAKKFQHTKVDVDRIDELRRAIAPGEDEPDVG